MNWQQMVTLEPRLGKLLEEVQSQKHRRNPNFCRESFWGGTVKDSGEVGIKYHMCSMVGFGAAVKELRTTEAYNIAYRILFNQVANCKHSGDCTYDFPTVPGSVKRQFSGVVFEPLLAKLRRAGKSATQ